MTPAKLMYGGLAVWLGLLAGFSWTSPGNHTVLWMLVTLARMSALCTMVIGRIWMNKTRKEAQE